MVFGLIVVNDVVVSMAWMAQAVEVSGGVGRVAILLSVAALVGSAIAILFGYLRPGLVYVTAGMVVGAQLAFAWATPESSGLPGTWWAWQLMIPVCVLICAAQPLPAAVPARAVALAAYTVLQLSPAGGPGARDPCHGLGPVLLLSLRGGRARDGTGVAPDGRGVRRDESRAARRGLCPAGCGCGSSTTAADSTPTGSAQEGWATASRSWGGSLTSAPVRRSPRPLAVEPRSGSTDLAGDVP